MHLAFQAGQCHSCTPANLTFRGRRRHAPPFTTRPLDVDPRLWSGRQASDIQHRLLIASSALAHHPSLDASGARWVGYNPSDGTQFNGSTSTSWNPLVNRLRHAREEEAWTSALCEAFGVKSFQEVKVNTRMPRHPITFAMGNMLAALTPI
jgi:hypothetical protein